MTKEWLSLLSSVDKIRSEFLVAVAGSSLFLLFSPPRLLQALGLLEAIGRIRTWLGITLLILPDVNYVGGSRQLRRRFTPGPPPAMAGGGDSEK